MVKSCKKFIDYKISNLLSYFEAKITLVVYAQNYHNIIHKQEDMISHPKN